MTKPKNLSEFFATNVLYGILCPTREQAKNLGRAFNALGRRWASNKSYITGPCSAEARWDQHGTSTVFLNNGLYGSAELTDADIIQYAHFRDEIETMVLPFIFMFPKEG